MMSVIKMPLFMQVRGALCVYPQYSKKDKCN